MSLAPEWSAKLATPAAVLAGALGSAFALPPAITVSEWADEKRIVADGTSAHPGPWSTDLVPYLREIMDALGPADPVKDVVFMKSAQVAGTEAYNNWFGSIVDLTPGPALVVHPTVDTAKAWHREKFGPMVEATPSLAKKLGTHLERKTGTTTMFRQYAGGFIKIAGANASAGLRSSAIRFLACDEIDEYPYDLDGQGDPVKMATARQKTFYNRKSLFVSTPTIEQTSRIVAMYKQSDQRRYHVPCPDCGHMQILRWPNLKFSTTPPYNPEYQCEECGSLISEIHKRQMVARGKWIAAAPGPGKAAGFHINALYSPFESWDSIVADWVEAQGNPQKLKAFMNLHLGEPWVDKSNSVKAEDLYNRREQYAIGVAPRGVLFVTCGVDVQNDRFEYEIVGWGAGQTSWSIDYGVIVGDTSQAEVWGKLAELCGRYIPAADGGEDFPILVGAIDSGGHRTQHVYNFTRTRHNWLAVKGQAGFDRPYVDRPSYQDIDWRGRKIKRGAQLWPIGKYKIQGELSDRLRLEPSVNEEGGTVYPQGYCHFPDYELRFFEELTSESLVETQDRFGRRTFRYVHNQQFRNEPLDCRIYASAAALSPLIGMHRYSPDKWKSLADERGLNVDEVMTPFEQIWNHGAGEAVAGLSAKERAARYAEMRRQRVGA